MRGFVLLLLLFAIFMLPALSASEVVLTVNSSEGGMVSVSGPVFQESPGVFRVIPGSEVTLLAVAEERYAFDRWLSDDPSVNGSRSNPLTLRLNSPVRVTALFRPLYERVEFVRVIVTSPVPISHPEIVLKGRRVTISAPEVFVFKDRDDMRYVFSAWILNGTTFTTTVISFIATSNVNLTAVYSKEFRFMGEWFRIEDGIALQRAEVELAPGVVGKVSCYRNEKLNVTFCATNREVYVPKDMYQDFQPLYEKYYRVTIRVVGAPYAEVSINGEFYTISPSKMVLIKEGSTLMVTAPDRVEDYVLQGEGVQTVKVQGPTTLILLYEHDPLSRFHPFVRGVGAFLLSTPFRDAVLSMPDPVLNLLAASPLVLITVGSVLSVKHISRRLKAKKVEEVVSFDEAFSSESPRQVGYAQSVERTVGIGGRLDDPELEAILQQARRQVRSTVAVQEPRGAKPVPIEVALKGERKEVAISYKELVSALLKGSLREEEVAKLAALGVAVVGEPEPLPLSIPDEDVVAFIGGDGRSYSLRSSGIRVFPAWSVRPEDLTELAPVEKKKVRPTVALSWCDVLEPHEVLTFSAKAATERIRLVMLFDTPEAVPPVRFVRLDPPSPDLLKAVAVAEGLRAGRAVSFEEAELAAKLASRLPGLQLAMARAFVLDPVNPLRALQSEKLGLALHAVQQLVVAGREVERRELEGWVADTLRAYGGVRMLKYREKVVNRLDAIIRVVEEWHSRTS